MSAFAATAAVFQKVCSDTYTLGHRRAHLFPQLLWVPKIPQHGKEAVKRTFRLPSWPWLSIDGSVKMWPRFFQQPADTPIAKLVEYSAIPVRANLPYDRVKAPTLKIRGLLTKVISDRNSMTACPTSKHTDNDEPITVHMDCRSGYSQGLSQTQGGHGTTLWCLPLVNWVPVYEWGIGKMDGT